MASVVVAQRLPPVVEDWELPEVEIVVAVVLPSAVLAVASKMDSARPFPPEEPAQKD